MSTPPHYDRNKVALITGASGGIGLDLVRLFARDCRDVVLVARSAGRLDQIADEMEREYGVRAHPIAVDLSHPDAPDRIFTELVARGVEVDFLVNNAGFGLAGPFAETDLHREAEMIQVNVVAPTHLTKLLLPGMLARRYGRILNVASTAAFQPGPFMAVYYASKAYVLSFSEAVAEEVRGSGVTVTALCPGATHTGFAAGARMEGSLLFRSPGVMDSRTVALAGYEGLMAGKRVVIPGMRNRLLAESVRLTPRTLVTRISRWAQHGGGK